MLEREDDELAAEGARILADIQAERLDGEDAGMDGAAAEDDADEDGAAAEIARVRKLGYNVDDFEIETVEFENCVHETVYPRGYERKRDFRRPKVKPKTYAFTLDKF